jgi:ABC-type bacteriocin/lantibiotic exporter with double-glycine peptidase domain
MTGGLDTEFHESGWEFSAGQAQLLGLGRALLQKNQILCLDQATNNLDAETQQLISKKITEKFGKCTVIAVAHRLQNGT